MPHAPRIPQAVASSRSGHGDRWKYNPNVSFNRLLLFSSLRLWDEATSRPRTGESISAVYLTISTFGMRLEPQKKRSPLKW
ncbi:hypothetical protein KY290_007360 [Solanum tuberosum]|uniref:Uncharacterized protein n=1 Tax=Solanum tuberosum TaxID=4113 RepID=A0ABQ7W7C2_SOLTU|nr:hypothetical protein KY289_009010 [Solanum tuberosum]KAH0775949.1 hypothetical protein KY290_007360 [Solanum tuberosum]